MGCAFPAGRGRIQPSPPQVVGLLDARPHPRRIPVPDGALPRVLPAQDVSNARPVRRARAVRELLPNVPQHSQPTASPREVAEVRPPFEAQRVVGSLAPVGDPGLPGYGAEVLHFLVVAELLAVWFRADEILLVCHSPS